jgi:hypothetical protein
MGAPVPNLSLYAWKAMCTSVRDETTTTAPQPTRQARPTQADEGADGGVEVLTKI